MEGEFILHIFLILVFLAFAYVITNKILDERAPEETVDATLIKKKVGSVVDANNMINTEYILFFDIAGKTKRFAVTYSKYEELQEGKQGKLTYKRNKFVSFL